MNILELAKRFKGKYKLEYKDKSEIKRNVKISVIPIKLCEFKNTELNLVAVYGFGKVPMMLITNLKSDDKRLCTAVCKVYLMRWRIEEYFKFKKQSFGFENLRVQSLKSIRNLDLLLTIAIGYVAEISVNRKIPDCVRKLLGFPSAYSVYPILYIMLSQTVFLRY